MKADVVSLLSGDPAIAAHFGTRIRWMQRDQAAGGLPSLVLNVVGGAAGLTNAGPDGYRMNRLQVDVYAAASADGATSAEALTVAGADLVMGRLHGFEGVVGATHFLGIIFGSERTTFDGSGAAAEDRVARVSLDFFVHWRTAP